MLKRYKTSWTSILKSKIWLPAIAISLLSGTAQAQWTLVDDFETHTAGNPIESVVGPGATWTGGGEGQHTAQVDPSDATNTAMQVTGEPGNGVLRAELGASDFIAAGATGTVFYRFRTPVAANGTSDHVVGLTDNNAITNFNFKSGLRNTVPAGANNMDARDGGTYESVGTLADDTWYKLWMVTTNTDPGTFKLYLQSDADTNFATQTELTSASPDVFDYRINGATDIINVYFRAANNAGGVLGNDLYFDDLYINSAAEDLTDPLATSTYTPNQYTVNATATAPTIDGVVTAGEWDDAAAEAGGWRILRDDAGPADPNNNRFRMMWDATNLYILYETDDATGYRDDNVRDVIRFGYKNINFYFDPDLDGEGIVGTDTMPSRTVDGYQVAVNMYLGTYVCASGCSVELSPTNLFDALNAGPVGLSSFSGAYSDATGGNNLGWLGMRGTQIGTVNANADAANNIPGGGVMEMAIPWSDLDAPGLDANMLDPGLNINGASPVNGDQWNFNIGFIGSTPNLPVWNWHMDPDPGAPLESFASHPHGVLTFVGDAAVVGDFSGDGNVDCDDVDFYSGNIGSPATGTNAQLNLDGDTTVTVADANMHITTLVQANGQTGTLRGDLDCDGDVDVLQDAFILIGSLGTSSGASYTDGDIDFDGDVDVLQDAFILIGNLGMSNE